MGEKEVVKRVSKGQNPNQEDTNANDEKTNLPNDSPSKTAAQLESDEKFNQNGFEDFLEREKKETISELDKEIGIKDKQINEDIKELKELKKETKAETERADDNIKHLELKKEQKQ